MSAIAQAATPRRRRGCAPSSRSARRKWCTNSVPAHGATQGRRAMSGRSRPVSIAVPECDFDERAGRRHPRAPANAARRLIRRGSPRRSSIGRARRRTGSSWPSATRAAAWRGRTMPRRCATRARSARRCSRAASRPSGRSRSSPATASSMRCSRSACLHVGIPYAPVSPAYSLLSGDFAKLRHVSRGADAGARLRR